MLLNARWLVDGYENAFPLRLPAKGEYNLLHCAPDRKLPGTFSEETAGFTLSGQRCNKPGQSLHGQFTTPVELQKTHGLLPDQFTCLFGPASSSWPDTVQTPDTHIGFREGITGSCRVVVAQTSAEARGCDSGKESQGVVAGSACQPPGALPPVGPAASVESSSWCGCCCGDCVPLCTDPPG